MPIDLVVGGSAKDSIAIRIEDSNRLTQRGNATSQDLYRCEWLILIAGAVSVAI